MSTETGVPAMHTASDGSLKEQVHSSDAENIRSKRSRIQGGSPPSLPGSPDGTQDFLEEDDDEYSSAEVERVKGVNSVSDSGPTTGEESDSGSSQRSLAEATSETPNPQDHKEALLKATSDPPITPITSKSKAIFGSAAKTLVSFTSVSGATRADFSAGPGFGSETEKKPEVLFPKAESAQPTTGEEEERVNFSSRTRLFEFDSPSKEWKEKGVGVVKINENQVTGASRILMRAEGVLKVLLNARLLPGVGYSLLNERAVRVILMKEQHPTQYLFRFKSIVETQEFLEEIGKKCDDI